MSYLHAGLYIYIYVYSNIFGHTFLRSSYSRSDPRERSRCAVFSPVDGGLGFSVWACDDSSGARVMHGLELPSARGRFASPDGCGQSVVASHV